MKNLAMIEYLSVNELENIKIHEYKSTGYTHLDNILDKYIWDQMANYLPNVNFFKKINLKNKIFTLEYKS